VEPITLNDAAVVSGSSPGPSTTPGTGPSRRTSRPSAPLYLGMLLLGIWLVLIGLEGFVPLLGSLGILLKLLAIAAGVVILKGR